MSEITKKCSDISTDEKNRPMHSFYFYFVGLVEAGKTLSIVTIHDSVIILDSQHSRASLEIDIT